MIIYLPSLIKKPKPLTHVAGTVLTIYTPLPQGQQQKKYKVASLFGTIYLSISTVLITFTKYLELNK